MLLGKFNFKIHGAVFWTILGKIMVRTYWTIPAQFFIIQAEVKTHKNCLLRDFCAYLSKL